jgi:hypothetical protein
VGLDFYLGLPDAAECRPDSPVEVVRPFTATHWGTQVMTVRDPDGRMRARLDIEGALGRAELSFVQLLHAVRTGEAASPSATDHRLLSGAGPCWHVRAGRRHRRAEVLLPALASDIRWTRWQQRSCHGRLRLGRASRAFPIADQ